MLSRRLAIALTIALSSLPFAGRPAAATECPDLGEATSTVYLPNITKTLGGPNGWVTPFIVQNVGSAATTLEVSFYGFRDGSLVTCRSVPGLLPGTSFADVPNDDADLPEDSQFSVVVRSFGSQVVSVVNEHQGAGSRAEALSYGGLASGSTTVALPYLSKGHRGWVTTMVIQNLGWATASVIVQLHSLDGQRSPMLTRTIAPGRSAAIDPTVESAIERDDELSGLVTATQPLGIVVNAHNDAATVAAPMAYSYNGVPVTSAAKTYLPYLEKEDLEAFGPGSAQVYVQNVGAAAATPVLTFRAIGGTATATIAAPAPVKPGETWAFDPQIAKVVGGYQLCRNAGAGKCIDPGQHALVVTGGAFAVLNAMITSTTALGFVGTATTAARYYLPNITRALGGDTGWTTPIVVQSAGATSATLRWYRFSDGVLALTQTVGSLSSGASVKIDPRGVAGLADGTQYAVVVDSSGPLTAVVLEQSTAGGDGAMAYEGFPALVAPAVVAGISVSPATVTVAPGMTQQFTATAKDAAGARIPNAAITWSVTPTSLGTISASGLFTAGSTAGSGTVTARSGAVSGTSTLVVGAQTTTRGGVAFTVQATPSADVYAETAITWADATTIATQVTSDLADVQATYGHSFATRQTVYVFATTSSYTSGLQTVLGFTAQEAIQLGTYSGGVFSTGTTEKAVAVNWSKARKMTPLATFRHELTHAMIDQVARPRVDGDLPAWIDEGSARQEEFTIAGSAWWSMVNRYSAASAVAVRDSFAVADLVSQKAWNARIGDAQDIEYFEASQLVGLLRTDVGTAGVTRIFDLMGKGNTFDAAFLAVTGKGVAEFAATAPTRLQALATSYPGIATASDTSAGGGVSYVLYGFAPNSRVTLLVDGLTKGWSNTITSYAVDAYGTLWGYLGSAWPQDTYTFTAIGLTPPASSQPGTTVTVSVTAVKTSSAMTAASAGGLAGGPAELGGP